jgi:hypothetical protein
VAWPGPVGGGGAARGGTRGSASRRAIPGAAGALARLIQAVAAHPGPPACGHVPHAADKPRHAVVGGFFGGSAGSGMTGAGIGGVGDGGTGEIGAVGGCDGGLVGGVAGGCVGGADGVRGGGGGLVEVSLHGAVGLA